MITAYHRPNSLDEALRLISRLEPVTVPLGGGTVLAHDRGGAVEVVDLQALRLNETIVRGNTVEIGATTTLQQLLEWSACPAAVVAALRLDAPLNLRNSGTVAGTLVTADGRSAFATALLALDAQVKMKLASSDSIALGEFLPQRGRFQRPYLITAVTWPLAAAVQFDFVARTPADHPVVAVAIARWPSGRTRVAVCGWGPVTQLAMDGPNADGVDAAVRNALHGADDAWGSAEYRMDAAAVLARRCLARLN